jgi:hypothetical protein
MQSTMTLRAHVRQEVTMFFHADACTVETREGTSSWQNLYVWLGFRCVCVCLCLYIYKLYIYIHETHGDILSKFEERKCKVS